MKSLFCAKLMRSTKCGLMTCKKFNFSEKPAAPVAQHTNQRSFEEDVKFYEDEFKKSYTQFKDTQLKIYKEEIGDNSIKDIDAMLKEIASLSVDERILFSYHLAEMNEKYFGYAPSQINPNWPQYESNTVRFWPPENPDWGKADISIGGSNTGKAADNNTNKSDKAAIPEKKEKEPEKKKQVCDVRLTSYDAAKKLVLIKEIRDLLKLGLKESKETVEKCPIVIIANSRIEEAEKVKERFKDLAVIDLI